MLLTYMTVWPLLGEHGSGTQKLENRESTLPSVGILRRKNSHVIFMVAIHFYIDIHT